MSCRGGTCVVFPGRSSFSKRPPADIGKPQVTPVGALEREKRRTSHSVYSGSPHRARPLSHDAAKTSPLWFFPLRPPVVRGLTNHSSDCISSGCPWINDPSPPPPLNVTDPVLMGFMGFGLATSFNVYALDRCRRCMENARNAWKTQLSIENFTIFPAQSVATKAGDKTSSSWKQKSDARLLRNCCFRTGVKSCGGLEAH